MNRFVDTSGWGAWLDRRELLHPLALAVVDDVWQSGGQLVTTNWVLVELTALMTSPLRIAKPDQIRILAGLRSDPGVRVIDIDPVTETTAWGLWSARPDKDWTMVDCGSFVVMQREQLMEVITADHHFEQAGFVRLLK